LRRIGVFLGALTWLVSSLVAAGAQAAPLSAPVVASQPVAAAGTDGFGQCQPNGRYATNRSESTLAVDPQNASHLVGLSKFFFSSPYNGLLTDWSQVYLFHLGSYTSWDGGTSWSNGLLPGYDCVSGPAAGLPGWQATTDPNVAFGYDAATGQEDVYSSVLAYNNDNSANALYVSKASPNSPWQTPVLVAQYTSPHGLGRVYDKEWIAADPNPPCGATPVAGCSPYSGNVYVAWTEFTYTTGTVYFSRSTDGGRTFSPPVQVSNAGTGPFATYAYLSVAPGGTLYLEYTSYATQFGGSGQAYVLVSTDGGKTFSKPLPGPTFNTMPYGVSLGPDNPTNWGYTLPNTTFRDGIPDDFTASQAHPGTLWLVAEQWDAQNGSGTPSTGVGNYDVAVYRSTDGGQSWQDLGFANDPATVGDTTDQFQPEVATDSQGHVAVAFYDRRNDCPTRQPAPGYYTSPGAHDYCIQTAVQWYDDATGAKVGSNILLGPSWDPQEPANGPAPYVPAGQSPPAGYVSDIPHSVFDPCDNTVGGLYYPRCVTFIGDYFGLAVANGTAYVLNVSTFPNVQPGQTVGAWSQASTSGLSPSAIDAPANDFYQQQVLQRVAWPNSP
jgi:hypothetical protein